MWPFKSKKTIKESGLLAGMTDWHSHVLPGVDDGIKTLEDSLEVLREYERLGVRKLWLTPHIMEDYPNTTDDLKRRFDDLCKAWTGNVELGLAAENMLDSLFEERLLKKDFLPIGDGGEHLLVETSYFNPPYGMDEMLDGIFQAGLIPLLAHPERYRYMEEDDYMRLRDRGIAFQMNYLSLAGGYGESAKKKAEWMLKNGMIDVIGSDVHRLKTVTTLIEEGVKETPLSQMASLAAKSKI